MNRLFDKKIVSLLFLGLILATFLIPTKTVFGAEKCWNNNGQEIFYTQAVCNERGLYWGENPPATAESTGVIDPETGANNTLRAEGAGGGLWAGFVEIALKPALILITVTLLHIISLLTTISGVLLNAIISFTIVDVAKNYDIFEKGINTGWRVIRDLANMSFIFILLYAAVRVMIDGTSGIRRLIISIIIAAILINFSMFFTKVAIDISNLISLTFYNVIAPGAATAGDWLDKGLSNVFMQHLELQGLYKYDIGSALDLPTIATQGVMASILMLITAFVFFAIAILFIVRFVILVLLIILSPIVFAASVLPALKKYKEDWVETLIGQLTFPPVYFIITWVALTIMASMPTSDDVSALLSGSGAEFQGNTAQLTDAVSTSQTFMNFAIVITLMIASILIAKSMATKGGGFGKKAVQWVGGSAVGGLAWGARNTAGRFGSFVADNETLKNKAPNSRIARLTLAAGAKTSQASFDARNAPMGIGKNLGYGKAGGKGGIIAAVKAKSDKEKKFAESLKPSDIAKAKYEAEIDSRVSQAKSSLDEATALAEAEVSKTLKAPDVSALNNERNIHLAVANNTSKGAGERAQAAQRVKEIEKQIEDANSNYQTQRDHLIKARVEKERDTLADTLKAKHGFKDSMNKMGADRMERRAEALTKNEWKNFFTNNVLGVGKVKRENLAAAAAIRKAIKGKTTDQELREILEKMDKEKKEAEGKTEGPKPEEDKKEGDDKTA